MFVGDVSADLHCDHLCRRPCCVNPAHVEPVTPRENVIRGVSLISQYANSEYCVNGHKKPDKPTAEGFRRCVECRKQKNQREAEAFKALPQDHPKRLARLKYAREWARRRKGIATE